MCGRREPASRRAAPRPRWRRVSSPARIPRRALGLRRCTWIPAVTHLSAVHLAGEGGRGGRRDVALVAAAMVPTTPLRRPRRLAAGLLDDLADVLLVAANSIRDRDAARAEKSLQHARGPRPRWTSWTSCPTPRRWGLDVLQVSPFRRRLRTGVREHPVARRTPRPSRPQRTRGGAPGGGRHHRPRAGPHGAGRPGGAAVLGVRPGWPPNGPWTMPSMRSTLSPALRDHAEIIAVG